MGPAAPPAPCPHHMQPLRPTHIHHPAAAQSALVLRTSVDATRWGGAARFVNHSCEPNLELVMVRGRTCWFLLFVRLVGMRICGWIHAPKIGPDRAQKLSPTTHILPTTHIHTLTGPTRGPPPAPGPREPPPHRPGGGADPGLWGVVASAPSLGGRSGIGRW